MISFFGPSAQYTGRIGVEVQIASFAFTINLLERCPMWGYMAEGGYANIESKDVYWIVHTFGLGPIGSLSFSTDD